MTEILGCGGLRFTVISKACCRSWKSKNLDERKKYEKKKMTPPKPKSRRQGQGAQNQRAGIIYFSCRERRCSMTSAKPGINRMVPHMGLERTGMWPMGEREMVSDDGQKRANSEMALMAGWIR